MLFQSISKWQNFFKRRLRQCKQYVCYVFTIQ